MIGGLTAKSGLGSRKKQRKKQRTQKEKHKFDRDSNTSGDTLFVGSYNHTRSVKGRHFNCLHNINKIDYVINYYITLYTLSEV